MTTLGELIAAAYLAAEGEGRERAERAARLLAGIALANGASPRLTFT